MESLIYKVKNVLTKVRSDLPLDSLFQLKTSPDIENCLVETIQNYKIDCQRVYIELWWSEDKSLQLLAIKLLPHIIQQSNGVSINILNETIKHLSDLEVTGFLAMSLAEIFQEEYFSWLDYLESLLEDSNKYVRCLAIQTLGYLGDYRTVGIPYFLIALRSVMESSEKVVQDCSTWTILHLSAVWPESVRSFILSFKSTRSEATKHIICNSAIGLGTFVEPLLTEWLEVTSSRELQVAIINALHLLKESNKNKNIN